MSKSDTTDTTGAQSRAEHHADSDAHTVRESRRRVRQALETHAVGREESMSGSDLAEEVPLEETTVRDIIAELRDDPAGPPIGGGSGQGYFIIADAGELDAWVEGVKAEIATKRERIQANVQAFNRARAGDSDA
jgi:hypothetical protein